MVHQQANSEPSDESPQNANSRGLFAGYPGDVNAFHQMFDTIPIQILNSLFFNFTAWTTAFDTPGYHRPRRSRARHKFFGVQQTTPTPTSKALHGTPLHTLFSGLWTEFGNARLCIKTSVFAVVLQFLAATDHSGRDSPRCIDPRLK